MVKILDCTTRDGGHQTNWEFEKKFVLNLINNLCENGVDFYEIGYRNNKDKSGKGMFYNCTSEFLKDFMGFKNNLKIGVMTDTSRFSYDDFPGMKEDCVDFVRIATHPINVEKTLEIAEQLYNKGYKIFIQLMEIPNVEENEYNILKNWKYKHILESLYIADSYSTVKPQDLHVYFNKLRKFGYENISFHAHNKSGLALDNTLEAIKLGAYCIDVSQNGLGGNLSFQEFLNSKNYL